jgi:hypothetical protein
MSLTIDHCILTTAYLASYHDLSSPLRAHNENALNQKPTLRNKASASQESCFHLEWIYLSICIRGSWSPISFGKSSTFFWLLTTEKASVHVTGYVGDVVTFLLSRLGWSSVYLAAACVAYAKQAYYNRVKDRKEYMTSEMTKWGKEWRGFHSFKGVAWFFSRIRSTYLWLVCT